MYWRNSRTPGEISIYIIEETGLEVVSAERFLHGKAYLPNTDEMMKPFIIFLMRHIIVSENCHKSRLSVNYL